MPFQNTNGVSCIANSVLQSLLRHSTLKSACLASRYEVLRLTNLYNNAPAGVELVCKPVRRMLEHHILNEPSKMHLMNFVEIRLLYLKHHPSIF